MTHDSKAGAYVQRTSRVQFGMVDAAVIRDEMLPANVKTVYTYLVTYCSDDRSAYPSRARIARQAGLSVRTVDAAIKHAEKVGLMTVTRRRDGRVNLTNIYELHDLGGGYIASEEVAGGGAAPTPPSATVAPKLDQVSIQKRSTRSHRKLRSPSKLKYGQIFLPGDFYEMEDGPAANQIIKCVLGIFEAKGLIPEVDAGDTMGMRLTKLATEDGLDRGELVEEAQTWADTGRFYDEDDEEWGWLATPKDQPPDLHVVA